MIARSQDQVGQEIRNFTLSERQTRHAGASATSATAREHSGIQDGRNEIIDDRSDRVDGIRRGWKFAGARCDIHTGHSCVRAPDANPCSVEVSESPSYRPLAHDVDPVLFAGADQDNRDGTTNGLQRVYVAGKRRAEKGTDGRWYSRALQAFTTHYFRITCGASQATGTFLTANIALGNTYDDTIPADPAVSARPYFSSTGSYAWPEFLSWNNQDPSARPETVIDPQTGMLLKRLALPQDQPINYLPGTGDHYFYSIFDPDGAWNMPSVTWSIANAQLVSIVVGAGSATVNTSTAHQLQTGSMIAISGLTGDASGGNGQYQVTGIPSSTSFQIGQGGLPAYTTLANATLAVTADSVNADDGTAASYTGTGSNVLFLRDQTFWTASGTNLWDLTLPTEYMTVSVKGWCSGTCAGEDAKIQVCLTINGVSCWPTNATAKYQEAALGTSWPNSFVTLGTAVPILDSWTPAGFSPLNRADLSTRSGQVNVDTNGVVTWQPGGYPNTYFSPNWTAGSRIWIAGSECKIAAMTGQTQLTIDTASCSTPLSLPLTNVAFTGSNFGFLLRKKTASRDQINVQYAKYTTGTSQYIDFTASGSAKLCSDTLTQNSVTGGLGYHCTIPSGWPLLYWVDHKTGDATYLGLFYRSEVDGPDGFSDGYCDGGATIGGTTPTAPETFYCGAADNEAWRPIIVSCTLTSTNQPGNQSVSCANLTPGTQGQGPTGVDRPVYGKRRTDFRQYEICMRNCWTAGYQARHWMLAERAGYPGVDCGIRSEQGGQRARMCRRRARRGALLRLHRRGRMHRPGGASPTRGSFRAKPTLCGSPGSILPRTIRRKRAMARTLRRSCRDR